MALCRVSGIFHKKCYVPTSGAANIFFFLGGGGMGTSSHEFRIEHFEHCYILQSQWRGQDNLGERTTPRRHWPHTVKHLPVTLVCFSSLFWSSFSLSLLNWDSTARRMYSSKSMRIRWNEAVMYKPNIYDINLLLNILYASSGLLKDHYHSLTHSSLDRHAK